MRVCAAAVDFSPLRVPLCFLFFFAPGEDRFETVEVARYFLFFFQRLLFFLPQEKNKPFASGAALFSPLKIQEHDLNARIASFLSDGFSETDAPDARRRRRVGNLPARLRLVEQLNVLAAKLLISEPNLGAMGHYRWGENRRLIRLSPT